MDEREDPVLMFWLLSGGAELELAVERCALSKVVASRVSCLTTPDELARSGDPTPCVRPSSAVKDSAACFDATELGEDAACRWSEDEESFAEELVESGSVDDEVELFSGTAAANPVGKQTC